MTPKRLVLLTALFALAAAGWPSSAEAQYPYPWGIYQYPHRFDPSASVRVEVKPNNAEVYVDGYYAGIVDDFDGTFQRLSVLPGEHEIALYLEGHRTVRQKVYVQPRRTFRIRETMQRLAPGEPPADRPQPINPPQMPPADPGQMYPPGRGPAVRRGPQGPPPGPQRVPPQQMPPPNARSNDPAARGTVAIRVQPADADVQIDGEPWQTPANQDRLVVDLPEGRHTISVRKAGYIGYVTEIEVRRGETTPLNVSLRAQE